MWHKVGAAASCTSREGAQQHQVTRGRQGGRLLNPIQDFQCLPLGQELQRDASAHLAPLVQVRCIAMQAARGWKWRD